MSFERPDNVRRAQREGDHEALKRMGKKGAEKANENKAIKKELREIAHEERLMDARYHELVLEYGEEEAQAMLDELDKSNERE